MSTITLPAEFAPTSFGLTMSVSQRVNASPFGGSEQAVDLLNDRWVCNAVVEPNSYAKGAALEAFIAAMRGQTNVAAIYHVTRPQPRGTARGTMLLNAAAAQYARTIVVKGISPTTGTLLAGDMLGVGGLLLMVAANCTAAAGVITVPIANALRTSQGINAAVTWDRPTTLMRILDTSGVNYLGADQVDPVSFKLGEKI